MCITREKEIHALSPEFRGLPMDFPSSFFSSKDMLIDLTERGREGEKHRIEPTTFRFTGQRSN